MPNTKSAEKRLRQNEVRRARNRSVKSAVKTQMKKVREAVAAGNLEAAATEFRLAAKKLDRAAATKTIHRNSASRHKARLSHLIKSAKDKAKAAAT
jgi:small subunit ribosomal protein S20